MKQTGIILVVLYAMVVSGLPLPVAREVSGQLTRFPCESSSCGCSSATQCWKSCCCSSLEEKILWAKANGVPVPDHALRRVGTEQSCCTLSEAGRGCYTTGLPPHTELPPQKKSVVGHRVCCDQSTKGSSRSQVNTGESSSPQSIRLIAALGCGGQSDGFPGLIPSLPPVAASHSPRRDVEKSCYSPCGLISCFSLPPATPPPQSG